MATTGKKINELTSIETVSNETVLPSVYVNGTTPAQTAQKISILQISNKVQDNMSSVIANKQDKLTAGEGIDITNNVISATNEIPEGVYTETNLVAGTSNVTFTKDSLTGITSINVTGGDTPSNVYTQDNLLAGKNITITENPKEGGIDEYTLACWHFDNSNEDVVSGNTIAVTSFSNNQNYAKFDYSALVPTTTTQLNTPVKFGANSTIDFWIYFSDTSSQLTCNLAMGSLTELNFLSVSQTYGVSFMGTLDNYVENCGVGLHHIAIVIDSNYLCTAYIDGVFAGSADLLSRSQSYGVDISDCYLESLEANNTIYVDEFRISNVMRWNSDFIPPTAPYTDTSSEPTTYSINAIGMVKSQTVQTIVPLTQAEYDNLAQESAIDPNTFYLIKSAS